MSTTSLVASSKIASTICAFTLKTTSTSSKFFQLFSDPLFANFRQAKCSLMESYANECRDMGTTNIFWRDDLSCQVTCGKNERFYDETDTEISCDGAIDISVDNHVVEGSNLKKIAVKF